MTAISLQKHLPRLFLDQLQRHPDAEPFAVGFAGVVMMTDISGFSALARELTRQGAHGAESLREVLDDYFGALGALVARYGGDICTFAGDAVIAVWPAGDNMAGALDNAARCALDIQVQAPGWLPGRDVQLTQRIALACGDLVIAKLGGLGNKWLNAVLGQTIVDAGRACDLAPPGQVLLTEAAAAALGPQGHAEPFDQGYLRLQRIDGAAGAVAPAAPLTLDHGRLAAYVPDVLVRRRLLGQADWLAEFRRVTVMFVKLDYPNAGVIDQLQDITRAIQTVVNRYGGAMPYLQMDDKGINFIIAFGIPTATHEDDAARALRAALGIQQTLNELGARPSIGVGTGVLYCGECGAAERRQYSLIGPAINFAARLAGAAPDDLLCDDETAKAASQALSFAVARNVLPKHETAAALAFRPEWRETAPAGGRDSALVGREAEFARLLAALEARPDPTRGAARLLVRGEPGIGKSRLLRELETQARSRGFTVLTAAASALEIDTPYFVWREILRLTIACLAASGETPVQTLLRQFEDSQQLKQWAPLLNDVLPLGLPASALTEEMRGAPRASSLQALLSRLLLRAADAGPVVLLVDDLHWLDQLSANALETVLGGLPGLPAVLGCRTVDGGTGERTAFIAQVADLETVDLGALDEALAGEMLARLYGIASVPSLLSSLVHDRAGGNPFYIEQLALELRESGQVDVVGGRCKLREDIARHIDHALPDTLRGVIESRVDRLGEEAQLVLKVASVFGRAFTEEGLRAVYEAERPAVDPGDLLLGLEQVSLLVEDDSAEPGYAFKHVLLQEAVYELLPLSQRKRLHRRIADWLESRYADALHAVFNVLASHCVKAEEFERAIDHLEGGAAIAIRHSAYLDAIAAIRTAQNLAAERALIPETGRQARWHGLLGDAHHERSEYAAAKNHFHQVLELLERRYAPSAAGRAVDIAARLSRRLAGPLPLLDSGRTPPEPIDGLISHAYQRLSEISYHDNDPVAVLHLNLLSVSHAQQAGSLSQLSAGYGGLAVAFGQLGLNRAAKRHSRHAIDLAERSGNANDIAYAHLLAMVYASAQMDWQMLDASARRAESLYGDLGDDFRRASVHTLWADCALLRGDYARAEELLARMAPYVRSNVQPRVVGWHLDSRLQLAMARGEISGADVETRVRLGGEVDSLVDRLTALGNCAAAWLRLGERARAMEAAEQGLELMLGNAPVAGAGYIHGPLGVVEVMLATCDGAPSAKVRQACARLSTYTRQVPSTRPRGYFLLGVHAELEGRPHRAVRQWRRAAEAAERLAMPYHRAVALLALGERAPPAAAALEEALNEFATLGVPPPTLFRCQQTAPANVRVT